MALGRPVVATDVAGIAEAVENEQTGLLVPAGDERAFAQALVRLASDSGLVQRLGDAALRRHRTVFGFDRMIAEYTAVFMEVLERRRCGELGHRDS
jgi:glycosyltransferase involved in cell wall biosynthesis